MKFIKVIALSIGLLTVAGMNAEGWLDNLFGTGQQAQTQQQSTATNDWMNQLGGLFGQKPAPAPAQLGQAPMGAQTEHANKIASIQQNVGAIIAKVREMAPAITTAVTNKDFTSAAQLAGPAKDILSLGMTTANDIRQVVAANPQVKGVVAGLVNQLSPVIAPLAAQIRTMAASAGWGTSFVLKTIASGLEQVPQLLNQAAQQ
ncbi:MAG: hypothetical protein AMXMBFR12_02760 [Candidatus Babeliales bacterium]